MSSTTQERQDEQFFKNFCYVSSLQGRLSYFLMSVIAVHPDTIKSFTDYDVTTILFVNMVYGMTVMLYTRPSMKFIYKFHRFTFSILGSLMFNNETMLFYGWILEKYPNRPYLRTFLTFCGGRLILMSFLAYLAHVDSYTNDLTQVYIP